MDIGPVKSKAPQIHFKQSKSEVLPSLPLRAMMLGNSGNGKTNLISSLITDPRFYRGVFAKLYWFSPTAKIDDSLEPVREYIEGHLEQNQEEDPSFIETLDTSVLANIISKAKHVMEYLKKEKPRRRYAYNILIVIDDLADTSDHKAQMLVNQLFIKARHYGISTILSTQKLRLPLVTQAVRVNITALFVIGKLRNQSDLWDGIIYEYSALVDKQKLMSAYKQATDIPYNFLYINLLAKDPNKMFYSGFKQSFIMDSPDPEST
jgi:hypothetical protein